ncbi:MAG: hypothetical protein ACYDBB_08795 [Armatimonadota bacterium]
MWLQQTFTLLVENRETLVTFALAGMALLKITAWGRANAEALQTLIHVIEALKVKEVKQAMAGLEADLSEAAQDVLRDAVATVDEKKTPLALALRVAREVLRGLFPVR